MTSTTSQLDDLLKRAQREIDNGRLPACQIAVARHGELLAFETYGDATPETRFVIFSCTKAFVCSVVWMLLGEGKLRLDQKIVDTTPGFETNGKDVITLEHILTHSAGIPMEFMNPFDFSDPEKRASEFSKWKLRWEPGTRFEYHALSGHWVLADLIEQVTGQDFREVVRERVVDAARACPRLPARCAAERAGRGREAADHRGADRGRYVDGCRARSADGRRRPGVARGRHPCGQPASSTAADVAMFYQALLANKRPLGSKPRCGTRRRRSATRITMSDGAFPMNYGLGVRIAGDDGGGWVAASRTARACSDTTAPAADRVGRPGERPVVLLPDQRSRRRSDQPGEARRGHQGRASLA